MLRKSCSALCCTKSNVLARSRTTLESVGLMTGENKDVDAIDDGNMGGKPEMKGASSGLHETSTFSRGMPGRMLLNIILAYSDRKGSLEARSSM
jgi:hypothetical protein